MFERVQRQRIERRHSAPPRLEDRSSPVVRRHDLLWTDEVTSDPLTVPTSTEGTRIRRSLAAGVIRREHDGVTIEEAPDEPDLPWREPADVVQPATPLMLTDRPWAQIEAERAGGGVTVEDVPDEPGLPQREPAEITQPATPLMLTDRPWAQIVADRKREIDQQSDPRWQKRVQEINRPKEKEITGFARPEGANKLGPIPAGMNRRRARQVGPVVGAQLQQQRESAFIAKQRKGIDTEVGGVRAGVNVGALATTFRGQQAADTLAAQQRAAENAPFAAGAGKAALDAKCQDTDVKVTAAKRAAKPYGIDLAPLTKLDRDRAQLQASNKWARLDECLDDVAAEASKLLAYTKSLDTTQNRISALDNKLTPQKRKIEIRQTYFDAFVAEVKKKPRNDAAVLAAVTALEQQLVIEEDKAANAAVRANQRANGLWPGNNNPAALIAERTRATVGASVEERTAVVTALDAVKTSTNSHAWALRWGVNHNNNEGNLPGIPAGGGYKEYYVKPNGLDNSPGLHANGVRRLVKSNTSGYVYYSNNHYGQPNGTTLPAFVKITDY